MKFIPYSFSFVFITLLLPSFQFSFIYSHQLAKLSIFIIFLYLFFRNEIILTKSQKNFLYLYVFFFLTQALSIISSIDTGAFLSRFEDIIFISVLFFVSLVLYNKNKDKHILLIFLSISLITFFNTIIQLFIFFLPEYFIRFIGPAISQGYLNLVKMNIDRNRIYFDSYDEIAIPIFFYLLSINNGKSEAKSILLFLSTTIISLVSLLSNFRTKFLMLLFSLCLSMWIYLAKFKKTALILFFISLSVLFFVYSFSSKQLDRTIFSRILLENEIEDVDTISSRFYQAKKVLEIISFNPLFGIGLGNYYYYTDFNTSFTIFDKNTRDIVTDSQLPHNYFLILLVETGIFSFFAYIIILIYFLKMDLTIMKSKKNYLYKTVVVSFWTLFIYSQFNPSIGLTYNILFWTLRTPLI